MTSRERWLAALQSQPVDRLPFWPKLDGAYAPFQHEPYNRWTNVELHRWIGSDQHAWGPSCVKTIRTQTTVEKTEHNNVRTTTYHTPAGTLTSVWRYDPVSHAWHPRQYPVKSVNDIEAMSLVYADERHEFDAAQYEQATALIQDVGEDGIVVTSLGISPLMDWIQHIAGIENGLLLLMDHPDEVTALFELKHASLCRQTELIAERAPYPAVYSIENTSTTLISPQLFRRHCLGHLMDYGQILRQAGKLHLLHMCGKLKLLLEDIASLPATGIEAFTSSPVGNTSMLDGRTACPDKCLIGGTNATLWLEPAETIVDVLWRDLDVLPHWRGLVLTSAGVMPPGCFPETIKQVAEQLRAFTGDPRMN